MFYLFIFSFTFNSGKNEEYSLMTLLILKEITQEPHLGVFTVFFLEGNVAISRKRKYSLKLIP